MARFVRHHTIVYVVIVWSSAPRLAAHITRQARTLNWQRVMDLTYGARRMDQAMKPMNPLTVNMHAHESDVTMVPAEGLRNPKMSACDWHQWVRELHSYFKMMKENNMKIKKTLLLHVGGN